jgi:predicted permease
MILASSFMNNGNYGTDVVLLLFRESGLDSSIYFNGYTTACHVYDSVYYAAKGSNEGNGGSALCTVKCMPIVYGALFGGTLQVLHISMGKSVQQAIDLVADAAIPTIMIVLGMQLAKISIKNLAKGKITLSLIIKLAI